MSARLFRANTGSRWSLFDRALFVACAEQSFSAGIGVAVAAARWPSGAQIT
jgi:hypothetical protein